MAISISHDCEAGPAAKSGGEIGPKWANTRNGAGPMRALLYGTEGNQLVEMALVMPIFLLLIFGVFKFGIAINNQLTLTQATGVGAQYLQQIRTNTTDPCADVFERIHSAAPTLTAANIGVTVTMNGTTPQQGSHSCSGAQTNLVQGGPVTVAATYPCDLTIYNANLAPGCQLQAQVTEYEY